MAYGLKYFSEFADDQEIGYRVEIHERDYSGDETEVTSSGNPFTLEVTEVDNIFSPIRTKKATIEWVATEDIAFEIKELDLADDQKYKVFLYEIGAGETLINKFTGYLVTVDCKEPFGSKPYPVQLSAACGLFFLRDYYFTSDNGEFVLDKINIKNTIGQCLQFANLELDFHTYVDLYDIQMGAGDPLALADFAADGLRGVTCYDALSGVLNAINAFVVQEGDVWVIQGIPDSAALECPRRIYDYQSVFKSSDTPNRAVSIGREPFNGTIPNLIPTENVTTSLAETSSVVKATMSPGIPVNRLANGQFAYPITGGNLSGWNLVGLNTMIYPADGLESPGWTRSGFGTIDSPYRFEMRGLTVAYKDQIAPAANFRAHYLETTNPVYVDAGLFSVSQNKNKKIKFIISGAYKSRGISALCIEIRLHDNDKDNIEWLDSSGKWHKEKKDRYAFIIDVAGQPEPNVLTPVEELPTQTFSVTSEQIDDFINVGGKAVARLKFKIFPGALKTDKGFKDSDLEYDRAPLLSLEDFAVSVTTETIYEGEHTYVADADLPIRNANEVSYTQIVADKINITTPEQVRLVNRVMTGYMTIHNTDTLTYGWKRRIGGQPDPIDNVAWPIQYKVLKERIRQVCGKRIVVEGDFLGYDLNASSSVFLQYDDVYDNSKFYTVTNWKWDVINRRYTIKLNELSLTKLSNSQEFIELDKEGSGDRGNRLYGNNSGGSTSGNGSNSPDIPEPIKLDPIDPLYFVVGKESTQSFDLGELIISGQNPAELESKFVYYPTWMKYPYEDRGEDGDLLTYTVTGTPIQKGRDQIVIEFTDEDGVDYLAVVPIIIEPETTNKNVIISGGDVIGKVPGFLELPDSWNFQTTIKGTHDKVEISVSGGGVDGSSYSGSITREPGLVEDGIYTVSNTPIVSEAGVYEYSVVTYRGLTETSREEGSFTLYDDEYLAKFSSEFIDSASGEILGVINPNGSSTFKQKTGWDIKSIITELQHDKITFTLKQDGVVVFNNSIDVVPAELEGEYLLFNTLQTEYGSGEYELLIDVSLDDSAVYQRLVSFSIAEEEVKPEAGLQLIEFTPNTTNYSVTQDLPLFNAEYDLPDNWGVLIPPASVGYDYVEWELADSTEGALANVNLENYTNYPQYQSYLEDQEKEDILIFGIKNSLDIGDIHRAPSTFRAKATFRLGGATGKIVAITQSDFGFRVPLQPEDYSGTRFINIDVATGNYTVVDENMPKEGRKYLLPEIGTRWTVSVRELNGETFNKVVVKLSKKLSGSYEVLHFLGEVDSVLIYTSPTDVNELPSDDLASVIGFVRPDGLRYLFDVSNNDILIDGLGDYKATFDFYLGSTLLGSKVTEFSLIDDTIPDIPVKDCCGSDADLPVYDVAGEWGGDNQILKITLTENGTISAIEEEQLDGVSIDDDVWNFAYAPISSVDAVANNELVNFGQLTAAVASGSADKTPVKTVATSNIPLTGLQTINGYTTIAGDRVLVQNQTNPALNGAYIANSGTWSRATDSDTASELLGATYLVTAGNASVIGTKWKVITQPITVGITPIQIVQIQAAESDPTVGAWIKAITSTQITNWDAAYSIANNFNSLFDTRLSTKSTTNLSEGTNLYFTEARVRATPLTGLSVSNSSNVVASDSILIAIGKLQARSTVSDNRWISIPGETVSLNNIINGGIKTWDVTAAQRPTNYGTAFTFVGNTSTGNGTPTFSFINQILAGINGEIYWRQSINDANVWTPSYQLWTTKHFTDTNITNWNTAFSWGNHALAGYVLASNFNTLFDARLATKTTNNLTEGTTNLYFTEARVRATLLTGLSVTTGLITATDSVLSAFGKLQGQITASGSLSGTTNYIPKFTSSTVLANSLWFDSGTRTGYGTSSPSSRLHISGSGTGGGAEASIALTNTNSSNSWTIFAGGTSTVIPNNSFVIGDNNNYRLIISDNGNVGIGTSGVAASQRLEVVGNIRTSGQYSSTLATGTAPFSVTSITLNQNLNADLLDNQHGLYYLDSANFTGTRATNWDTAYGWGNHATAGYALSTSISGSTNYLSKFISATTLSVSGLYETGGRLGYGTTTPATKIHISGNTNDVGLTIANTASTNTWSFYAGSPTSTIPNNSFSFGDNTNYRFIIGNNGNVGIGTGANIGSERLEVSGGNIKVSNRVIVAQPGGTSPFLITSTTLNGNLNADLLDDQHGAYYLNSANFTGTRATNWDSAYSWGNHALGNYASASLILTAGTGLQGGGNLYADRSFSVLFGTTAGTVAQGNDGRIAAGQTAFSWGNHAGLYAPINHTHTFSSITDKPTTLAGYGITDAYTKSYIDALDRVPGSRVISAGTGLSGGGNLYADRSFSVIYGTTAGTATQGNDSRINAGQTAFSWGNHASQGYLTGITSPMVTNALTYTPIPNNRTITINGNTQYLNDNPNFTISSSGGNVTGSGTNGYVTKWTGGSSIGNSRIIDNGFGNITFVGAGLDATNLSLDNNLYAGSGTIAGTFAAGSVSILTSFTLRSSNEAGLPSVPEGSLHYVNSGTGKGLWCYMGSNGWKLMATRAWVGSSNPGSSPP